MGRITGLKVGAAIVVAVTLAGASIGVVAAPVPALTITPLAARSEFTESRKRNGICCAMAGVMR